MDQITTDESQSENPTTPTEQILETIRCFYLEEDLPRVSQAIEEFLRSMQESGKISSVAFFDRREPYLRPILDIFAVWAKPLNLLRDGESMHMVSEKHDELFQKIEPELDSFFNMVDPRMYTSTQKFEETFPNEKLIAHVYLEPSVEVNLELPNEET